MKEIDFLELPRCPNFLRFKDKKDFCFPIWQLSDRQIKELYNRMAKKTIEEKHNTRIQVEV